MYIPPVHNYRCFIRLSIRQDASERSSIERESDVHMQLLCPAPVPRFIRRITRVSELA